MTVPLAGNERRTLTPLGLSVPWRMSVIFPESTTPVVLRIGDSRPAGAFHTPRVASVRAITPATKPLGGRSAVCPVIGSLVFR